MKKKKEEKKAEQKVLKNKTSRNFVIALSVVSIIGFLSIVLDTIFSVKINDYIETLWLIALGIGLIFETSLAELKKVKVKGLTADLLGKITMLIIGSIAVIAGILSLPQIAIQNPVFFAVKGIVSILAIIFIILQTWVTEF